jgi:hypothetical protein
MRVVPTDVLRQIERFFPNVKVDPPGKTMTFFTGHSLHFMTILKLVEQIPEELIVLDADDFCAFQTALVSMRSQIEYWHAHGDSSFSSTPGYKTDPVTLVYSLLSKCPDEAPVSATTGLDFLTDESQRLDLRTVAERLTTGTGEHCT